MAGYESGVSSGNPAGRSVDYTSRNRPSRIYENPLCTGPGSTRLGELSARSFYTVCHGSGFAAGHVYAGIPRLGARIAALALTYFWIRFVPTPDDRTITRFPFYVIQQTTCFSGKKRQFNWFQYGAQSMQKRLG
ncbi:uncharacterized protein LOC116434801 isoform X1 [Nomia melanderi]|uniref:uncharacterized protein LOC116434801 isoform X1 n=1 Tax=Nomia melanderi TaxID=2448451 RepID=UPI003FCE4F0E